MLHVDEWMSEMEMPDQNVDGTPMVNGIDINGRPYGVTAEWEDDPHHVNTGTPMGSMHAPRVTRVAVRASDARRRMCVYGGGVCAELPDG